MNVPSWAIDLVRLEKRINKIAMTEDELLFVADRIQSGCQMLVFGVGNDSNLWEVLNDAGLTIFLEDDEQTRNEAISKFPDLLIYPVNYPHLISDWKSMLADLGNGNIDNLVIPDLPREVGELSWDLILVNGPCGSLEWSMKHRKREPPGRMSALYSASVLIRKPGGVVYVHDNERQVESTFTKYLFNKAKRAEDLRTKHSGLDQPVLFTKYVF